MEEKQVIILWRQPDGTVSHAAPGRAIASTISEGGLKRLAKKHTIFVLELTEEGIEVEEL